ncbi:MAG TPA: Ig-like domain-containing protein [Thermoanaerobaculia bacterium]
MLRPILIVLLVDLLALQPLAPTQPLYAADRPAPAARPSVALATDSAPPPTDTDKTTPAAESESFTAAVDASALDLFVGFADSSSPSANFPTPWQGAPNVVYLGGGHPVNAGAIRIDNPGSVPVTIDKVSVDLQRAGAEFALWQNFTIPARGAAILTQTQPGNFDTSAYPLVPCGATLPANDTRVPKITITAGGTSASYLDSAHVLDTGGFDSSCRGNESLQWRRIGTSGLDAAGGTLGLTPANLNGNGGSPVTLLAHVADAGGLPLPNVVVDFKAVSGPNAGQTSEAVTDARGDARFTYTGTAQGADVVRATITNASGAAVTSNDATVAWTTASCGPDVPQPPAGQASLLYVGATRAQYSDPFELAALLTDTTGAPVAGRSVTFTFGAQTFNAITDATGVARVALTAAVAPAEVPVTVSAGDLRITQTITIVREDVRLEYTGKTLVGTAVAQTVTATLKDPDTLAPIAGKTLVFNIGAVSATGVTDANGVATASLTLSHDQLSGPSSLTVTFAGDTFYEPAARTTAITIYLSTSFVVWGGNTAGLKLGQRVTFWGAQWDKQVLQGEYAANSAFKGFADPVDEIHVCQPKATAKTLTPDCWVSKGGQSWPPPVSVPAYIEVIVSTAMARKGNDLYGNIAAAVVVKVETYGTSPGKEGTGTIVSVIEDSGVFPAPAAIKATQTQPLTVLPNELFTVTANLSNTSLATGATNVVLDETLDGVSPAAVNRAVGAIPAGDSRTVTFQATTPSIDIRGANESPADYLRRLSALNGRVYTSAGRITFTDANQQGYLPVEVRSQSILAIPVVTLALSGPSVVSPGSASTYNVTATNIGGAPASGSVDVTMPDGTQRTLTFASLAAGSSYTQLQSFTPAAIAPKGESETTEQYLARLRASDGELLTAKASLTWRDAAGNAYGDVGQQLFTSRVRVPVLSFTTEAPVTILPTQTVTLKFNVRNDGGCTAVLTSLDVTNPDATITKAPQFVLGAGETKTIETTWRVPEVPKRDDDGESDAQYLARIRVEDQRSLPFTVSLGWSDPAGTTYGNTADSAATKQIIAIVPLTLTAPATATAGDTIAYNVTATNIGSAVSPETDLTVTLPNGSIQKPLVGPLAPGATFQTTLQYAIPITQTAGIITASALGMWTDGARNAYGPLGAAASTDVANSTLYNSLVLTPANAGPNVAGTTQIMTATLKDTKGVAIAGAVVTFSVTGAHPSTGSGTTDANGIATFSFTGATAGNDVVQATSGAAVSNTANVSWIVPVQKISTTPLLARYFFSNGSGVFNTPATATPAFMQAFPTINFNPPGGTIPGGANSGVGVNSRPFTNVTTDLNGNFTGTIIAQGNGLQAGVGTMFDFQAVYTGAFTVASAGDMIINFYSDDGFVFGVGGGATRVSGPMLNVPPSGVTEFEKLLVVASYNAPSAPTANRVVVRFPAAGIYPYEVDYSECCAGQLALTVAAGGVGMPPTGSLKLGPLSITAKPAGQTQTLTVDAVDGGGAPVPNAHLGVVINGPNAQELSAVTDIAGRAVFTYSATRGGTDTAQAIGRVAGLATFSNVINVPWTSNGGGGADPTDPDQPSDNIGNVVTQGWIGAPAIGSTLLIATPITVNTSLASGIIDFWPTDNPAEIKVLNGNVTGSGTKATIDPTTLANGEYTIRLRGTLSNGTQQTSLIVVDVTGDNKPGRVTKYVTDLRVPLAGMPVTISRKYDSLEKGKVGDFGYGWSLDTSVRLEVNKKNDVTFSFNGRRQTFKFSPQSSGFPFTFFLQPKWVPEAGTFGTLTAESCGLLVMSGGTFTCFLDVPGSFAPTSYTYTDPYGRQYVMGADGSMKSIKDLTGNMLTFGPDGITSSASGITVPFERDAKGRITRITDPAGNHFDYTYDGLGDLTSVKLPSTTTPVRYEYAAGHYLTKEIDPRGGSTSATYHPDGRLKTQTDRMGHTTQYAYATTTTNNVTTNTITTTYPDGGIAVVTNNANGDPLSVRDQLNRTTSYTYDANSNLLTRTDALGKTWTFTYDANGNLTSEKDPLGNIVKKSWDARGRLLNITDALNQVKTLGYDASGNVTSLADTAGMLMGLTYDSKGQRTSMTLASGQRAEFGYDTFGNMTALTDHSGFASTHTYDGNGLMTSVGDAKHGTMTLAYDLNGNQTLRRDSLGNELKYSYDANGNRTGEADANGNPFTHEYDGNDRVKKTTYPDGTSTEYTYDWAGRVLTRKDQDGTLDKFTYDKAGQLTSVTYAFGTAAATSQSCTYDPAGRLNSITDARNNLTVLTYDDAGRVKALRDPAGHSTDFTYDAAGQVTAVKRPDGVTQGARYDTRGRVTQYINPDGTTRKNDFNGMFLTAVTREDGRKTSFTYDNHSQIASVTDPAGNVTRYSRDVVGNMTSVVDPKGRETTFEYDKADRPVKKIYPDGSFEQYTYDAVGHMTAVRLPDGHVNNFTWDALDRLLRIDYFDGGFAQYTYTPAGHRATASTPQGITRYDYDDLDRLVKITQPTGVVVSYTYDGGDNITAITTPKGVTRYTWDQLDRLKTVTDPTGGVTEYTYDLGGRLTQRKLANGVITDYTYDTRDRLLALQHHLGASTSFQSFTYTVAANGQRASVQEVDGTRTTWTYDDAYRLTSEKIVNGTGTTLSELAYAYDQAGNRTSATSSNGATTAYQYNQLDQLTTAGNAQYTYDERGNLTRITTPAGTTTYGYDAANRMTSALLPNGSTASYTYDADGRLVGESSVMGVRGFAWDEQSQYGDIVYETNGASSAGYSYGDGDLVHRAGATSSYYLQDGLGSIVGLTNAGGQETDRYRYDGFGVRYFATGTTPNPFGYRGQMTDDATGLQYLRARWFSPHVGRFTTRDTADFNLQDPIDLNRYNYAGSNPVNGFDPTGHSAMVEYGAITNIQAENATIQGYLMGRLSESLIACALTVMMAMFVDAELRSWIGGAVANPINGKKIWKGLPNVITIAFGWSVKRPIDRVGSDAELLALGERGRKIIMAKAGAFRSAPRELSWAMSGKYVNALFQMLGEWAQLLAGIDGRFLGNEQNLADKCDNHAERKIIRDANPPNKSAVLAVGASRPVCNNCRPVLLESVVRFGGCIGPIGTNNQCRP